MHELSLAQSILDAVLEIAEERGAERVLGVRIRVGEFTMVNPEQLRFCLEALAEGTPAEGAEFEIELERGRLRCRECGEEWSTDEEEALKDARDPALHAAFGSEELPSLLGLRCPRCGSRSVEIRGGDSCEVRTIRLEFG